MLSMDRHTFYSQFECLLYYRMHDWISWKELQYHITGSCDQGCEYGFEGLTFKNGIKFIQNTSEFISIYLVCISLR